jgi:glycosyltransferase involved in cell wall biosynthesis
VNSRSLADELSALGMPEERVLVLPNCVEVNGSSSSAAAKAALADLGFEHGHRVFGCVGNIRRVKNQALFVRAMERVIGRHPEARGAIVGETLSGEETTRIELEQEIERLGLSGKVVLTGFRADVTALMSHLTALCSTSDSEGMPNVLLEAMAAGVPVVATAVGGVPEVVTSGETGSLVSANDELALGDAMCRVLEAPDDALRMAQRARARVEMEHSCSAMARRLETAYSEAIAAGGSA